ncbi:division initiation protein [Clostridium botulinum]|nr:division initiation protein [Clostridium botulinum]KIN82705.1 division initiation protein [Clostridium botulinum]
MDIIIRDKEKYLYFSFFILYRNIYYKVMEISYLELYLLKKIYMI